MSLLTSLIAAWELNEASGNALDSQGTNPLTDTNTVTSGTGLVYGTARSFSAASSQRFTHSDNTDLSTGDIDFTFEVWINVTSLTTFRSVFSKDNGTTEKEFSCYVYPNGTIQFSVSNNGLSEAGVVTLGSGTITVGDWIQIICWHDSVANETAIVKNAGTPATTSYSGGGRDGTAGFQIGALDSGGTLPWDGLIGPLRFWKRVLTSQERTDLYNGGAGLTYANFSGGDTLMPQICL